MHLQRKQHIRQKKQWNFLSKHLRNLIKQGRFQRFSEAKQSQLIQKLKSLFQKMIRFEKVSKLKKALGVAALLLGLQTTPALQAQVNFAPPVHNPFGLVHNGVLNFETLVDIDGDGDLDIISISYEEDTGESIFSFIENESLNGGSQANFIAPVTNVTGIQATGAEISLINPSFGDIDNDGDLDLFIGIYNYTSNDDVLGKVRYYENVGDVNTPEFATPIINPFNIDLGTSEIAIIQLADIDGDGDLDLFNTFYNYDYDQETTLTRIDFFENIGTVGNPDFGGAQVEAFGLPLDFEDYAVYEFADIDNDGDLDFMAGGINFDEVNIPFTFFENTGDATHPQFGEPVSNPFSLESLTADVLWPHFGDLDNDGDLDMLTSSGYDFVTEVSSYTFHENLLVVGVKETRLAAQASVSPNISSGIVSFHLEADEVQAYFQFSLISVSGQLIRQWTVEGGQLIDEKIDLNTLPAANYFIQVRTPQGVLVKKVIRE